MKQRQELEELRALGTVALQERLNKARSEMYRLRAEVKSGQLKDNAALKRTGRLVARILTILKEQARSTVKKDS